MSDTRDSSLLAPLPDYLPLSLTLREIRLVKGEVLFHTGDTADEFHFVRAGELAAVRCMPNGAEAIMLTARPGEFFGEACLFLAKIEKDADGKYKTRIFDSVTLDQESGARYGPRKGVKAPHPVVETQLHKSSNVCATCHLNQEKHLSISTFDDWNRYFTAGKVKQTCQECHMPLHKGKKELAIGGAKRDGVRAHTFVGAQDPEMLKKALRLDARAGMTTDGKLLVTATVENVGAGHKVPGSGPIRNVILKIDAWDQDGKPLVFAGPDSGKLHPLAGMGNPKTGARDDNDWGGLPGKMYAKIFASKPNPQTGKPMLGVGGFAADTVALDNGLEPFAPDTTEYQFELPEGVKTVKVRAKLVYRYAFKPIIDRKGWSLDERPSFMAEKTLNVPVAKLKPMKSAVNASLQKTGPDKVN